MGIYERSLGRNWTLPVFLSSVYFTFTFFAGTAVVILLPGAPGWLEIAFATIWLLLGLGILATSKGRETGGYFALSTGALIMLGNLL